MGDHHEEKIRTPNTGSCHPKEGARNRDEIQRKENRQEHYCNERRRQTRPIEVGGGVVDKERTREGKPQSAGGLQGTLRKKTEGRFQSTDGDQTRLRLCFERL